MVNSIKTQSSIMRFLIAMLLLSFLLAGISVVTPVQIALAGGTTCDSWQFAGCCESWWPCRQDYYFRQCWNMGNTWWEYSCNVISVCDYGC